MMESLSMTVSMTSQRLSTGLYTDSQCDRILPQSENSPHVTSRANLDNQTIRGNKTAVSYWSQLSLKQQAQCFGKQRLTKCCGQYAWEIGGKLLADWEARVYPQVDNLIRENYSRIHKKGGFHPPLGLQPYLLGPVSDTLSAQPSIVIWGSDQRAAKRAQKLVQSHELFRSLNSGYVVVCEKLILSFAVQKSEAARDSQASQFLTLPVVAFSGHLNEGAEIRRATITCNLIVNNQRYAILPAHTFYRSSQSSSRTHLDDKRYSKDVEPSLTFKCDDDVTSDTDSEFGSDGSDMDESTTGQPEELSYLLLQHPISVDPLCNLDKARAGSTLVFVVNSSLQPNSTNLDDSMSALRISVCPKYDFALIPLQNKCPSRLDRVEDFSAVHEIMYDAQYLEEMTHDKTTGSLHSESVRLLRSGFQEKVSTVSKGASTMLLLPFSSTPTKVMALDFVLNPGESGSPILSQDGELFGIAMASVPEMHITYMVPAIDVLDEVGTMFGTKLINLGLSSNSDDLVFNPSRHVNQKSGLQSRLSVTSHHILTADKEFKDALRRKMLGAAAARWNWTLGPIKPGNFFCHKLDCIHKTRGFECLYELDYHIRIEHDDKPKIPRLQICTVAGCKNQIWYDYWLYWDHLRRMHPFHASRADELVSFESEISALPQHFVNDGPLAPVFSRVAFETPSDLPGRMAPSADTTTVASPLVAVTSAASVLAHRPKIQEDRVVMKPDNPSRMVGVD